MVGIFQNENEIVQCYSQKLIKMSTNSNSNFIDIHIDEFDDIFKSNKEFFIEDIVGVFHGILKCLTEQRVSDFNFLCLVMNTHSCNESRNFLNQELEISNDSKIIIKDYRMPPNLYLLKNPFDLMFFEFQSITNVGAFYEDKVFVFLKKSSPNSFNEIDVTLNFMSQLR